tara:strand:+ start:932 stop:1189 length:258 start_codon:yes stop_codon:yes gene_type:complete
MAETEVGEITHFFDKVSVAVIQLTKNLKVGDRIHIKGATTDFEQNIDSMQIDRKPIEEAKPGDDIGMKTEERVRAKDKVYLIKEK